MSEENQEVKEEEKTEEAPGRVVKLSHVLQQQAAAGAPPTAVAFPEQVQQQIKAQIEHNQELYTTLSRSILELHNDMRGFRQKTDGLDRVVFSLQQGINKGLLDLSNRLNDLESRLGKLTEHWNKAVQAVEESHAINEEGEENQEGDGEDLREEEG